MPAKAKEPAPYHPANDPGVIGVGRIYDLWVPPGEERSAVEAVKRAFQPDSLNRQQAAWFVNEALSMLSESIKQLAQPGASRDIRGPAANIWAMSELAACPALACREACFVAEVLPRFSELTSSALDALGRHAGVTDVALAIDRINVIRGELESRVEPDDEDILRDAHF